MSIGPLAEFLCDSLRPLGPVMAKRMFSGAGIFCDGLMFALIIGDAVYLKTDADGEAAFKGEGMGPFVYQAKGRSVALGYWRMPERLLDEPDELVVWSRAALAVAHRAAREKAKGKASNAPAAASRPKPSKAGKARTAASAKPSIPRR